MPAFSAIRPVNPLGASPVLTEQQVWKGIELKVRQPQLFIPQVKACRVVKDEGNKVTRIMQLGDGPERREEIEMFEPVIAYFEMFPLEDPSTPSSSSPSTPPSPLVRITNSLSYGPRPSSDLYLAFSFSSLPHIPEEQARGMSREELNEVVGKGVEATVEKIRELVRKGEL